ncbi:Cvm1p KNAG_0I00870 [Huiozyma naganishii CBS 8797]|uniref:Uncharacterized protein n=1 Tax=Huiozyma naganishii (strain ATCC MYA-139 / BCRC 22969 / CBS 8797 / KCTC 17520 / NBRC 10181 / NCYC 3082 / Yp74L-3) TaxID=1071383 RepID=J7RQ34_HUIN7|nr:hypothetical protein KNAG_0I00870 [Kazachstania naganishii CBS 8797]CCK71878.1 hypothetical protein KNAG_0I00870 [Kazachstania naganishii CBS 8797]
MADQGHWYSRWWYGGRGAAGARGGLFPPVTVDDTTRYSQLQGEQIEYLEQQAREQIHARGSSWCWYEDLSCVSSDPEEWTKQPGVAAVFGTGSGRCPLPLPSYPMDLHAGHQVYIRDSLLLPGDGPEQYLHTMPLTTRIANAVKEYYHFRNETHLYLNSKFAEPPVDPVPFADDLGNEDNDGVDGNEDDVVIEKTVIISMVGWLPDKYEKYSLKEQRTAQYLSKKLACEIRDSPISSYRVKERQIFSLSFECPLDTKQQEDVLEECKFLLQHWEHILQGAHNIYFIGVYHSVPLAIELCYYIMRGCDKYGLDRQTVRIGLLSINSCLQGYRFWDHSVDPQATEGRDTTSGTNDNALELDYARLEQAKEKQLFAGLTKEESDLLSRIKGYSDMDSKQSRRIQQLFDWLCFFCPRVRINLVSSVYDNFMTMTQKLAMDYFHPKIIRNLWCHSTYLDMNTREPREQNFPDFHIKTPKFEFEVNVPRSRLFEIELLNELLLMINLGKVEFVPIFKLISPYFISRSFNENTLALSIKKSRQNHLKIWMQEMSLKWAGEESVTDGGLPRTADTVHNLLEYVNYQTLKAPDLVQIYSDIYDDNDVYRNFVKCTQATRTPTTQRHVSLLHNRTTQESILNAANQYDLVWKLHETLTKLSTVRNLPVQPPPTTISFKVTWAHDKAADSEGKYPQARHTPTAATVFHRDARESLARVVRLWNTYQLWDPQTRGLIQLKRIFSVLATYSSADQLIADLQQSS